MTFLELGLSDGVVGAVTDAGYKTPTPIQEQAIPVVLQGRDVLGCAQTGTGKTASFTLPMIDILASGRAKARMPRSLILCPTRELAAQVADNFNTYGKNNSLTMVLLIGGVAFGDQTQKLDRGVDVLIATPGRLLDHIGRGKVLLNDVKILVIDEADRMLDMGFIPDVEKIVSLLPRMRQTLFFSATLDRGIRKLADAFLINPKEITVAPPASTADTVVQHIVHTDARNKRDVLRSLIESEEVANALIFCNRKRDCGVVHRSLVRHGYDAVVLHGDMSQPARTETLTKFKAGEARLLVCSDVAARGLDIAGLSHVFNFDVPTSAEDYVHRIGRTGRAGRGGRSFTLAAPEDSKYVQAITKLINKTITVVEIDGLTKPGRSAPAPGSSAVSSPGGSSAGSSSASTSEESRPSTGRRSRPPRRSERERAAPSDEVTNVAVAPTVDTASTPAADLNTAPASTAPDTAASTTDVSPADAPGERDEAPRRAPRQRARRAPREETSLQGNPNPNRRSRHSDRPHPGEKAPPPVPANAPTTGMGDHVPAFMLRPGRTGTA
ncbi:MAG: DEAD/DEAH box helicase [Proteobacteria bacterium]|nr:DEAD/DEAH box helicase [Pseudomonadota bacterium]